MRRIDEQLTIRVGWQQATASKRQPGHCRTHGWHSAFCGRNDEGGIGSRKQGEARRTAASVPVPALAVPRPGCSKQFEANAIASFGVWALDIFQVEIDLEHTNVHHELVVRQSTVDQISPNSSFCSTAPPCF